MLRRLHFRYLETFRKTQDAYRHGYGTPRDSKPEDCQIWLPRLHGNALADNDAALSYVGEKLSDTLKPAA